MRGRGCLSRKKSSDDEGSVRMRSPNGMCCLRHFKSSGESYREERRTCCLGLGKCGLSCCRCEKTSGDQYSMRKTRKCGMACFCCHKSSKEEEWSAKKGKCGMCCFCHKNSLEGELSRRRRGKCGIGFLCCNTASEEEESTARGGERGGCCFFFKGSSKVEDLSTKSGECGMTSLCCKRAPKETLGNGEKATGCFDCCSKVGCLHCCKSSHDEEPRRGEKVTCCYRKRRSRENDSSSKRGCARVMDCSYLSICASKKKNKSSRRFCWRTKANHSTLAKSNSFKPDNGNIGSALGEILRLCNVNIAARVFKLRELAEATQNFSPECLLGQGGSGRVYKGQLQDTNQIVAVKQLDRNENQGNREFLIEVLMLSLLNHRNLVNLLGYCVDREERILVYDYLPLGSLQDHLHDRSSNRKPLNWNTRMKIAAGVAKGLEYLHDTTNPPVIYRDLKASNILLDEDFTPKLSDFGLAKLGPVEDKKYISTRVMGAYGYCAPEYAITSKLTKMSDVYSFGVVLLELITGRKPMDKNRPLKEQLLVEWVMPLFKDKRRFTKIADPLLEGNFPIKSLFQALAIASQCLQEKASTRPVIRDIVIALEFLAGQNCNSSPDESEESTPQTLVSAESEIQRCRTASHEEDLSASQSEHDWLSCSANNEDEIKPDTDTTEESSSTSGGGAIL